jgi:hypothetical protein
VSTQTARVANQSVFRAANQAVQRNREPDPHELLIFLCECSDLACRDDIELTLDEYGTVRSGQLRFAVATGHEDGHERVLHEFDRYTVVEK